MSTHSAPPGWHPDPGSPATQLRWWDGARWTEHVHPRAAQPVAPAAAQAWGGGGASSAGPAWTSAPGMGQSPLWGYQQAAEQQSFARENRLSLIAGAVVAVYVVIALTTGIVFIGILPVVLSVRAMRSREPLAPFAVGAAIVAVVVAFATLTGH